LFTQAQAMGYAADLSQAIANHEADATRKSFLAALAAQCATYHDRAMDFLTMK
jgi:hypothetical protein